MIIARATRGFQVERKEAFKKIRDDAAFSQRGRLLLLRKGACLISMLHYPTRPRRIQILHELGIHSISLDSIINDNNLRLVENMRAVAWNGLETAFDVLEKRWPGLLRPDGKPFQVLYPGNRHGRQTCRGSCHQVGDITRNNLHIENHGPGALALSLGRSLSSNPTVMESLIRQSDILVDASQRRDATLPVIPNAWLAWLPEHAVIVDLSVDPYLLDHNPPTVRGIEGIPQGNLDQYIFMPDDPEVGKNHPA